MSTWDAENRPIKSESLGTLPSAARVREEWSYLADGRWSQRIVSQWNGSAFVPQFTNRFVWDGVVLLAVLNGNNGVEQSYLRGLDLSGSLSGAGGVGGLLAVNAGANGVHFVANDGNGNVSALIDAANGTESARYEYNAFGETLRATGPMALVNFLRFSTQFTSDVTRCVKYLYREYVPELGRWSSRDPIEEEGGLNVYAFNSDDPVNRIDKFGLASSTTQGIPHVSNDQHDNYLIFYATCPRGWTVTAVTVTYDSTAMANGMLTGGGMNNRRRWLLNFDYGGLKSVGRSNCRGEPVEVQAYMRTRLVAPGLQFASWRAFNGLPNANDMLALYVANTQIHWLCNNCCERGMSTP